MASVRRATVVVAIPVVILGALLASPLAAAQSSRGDASSRTSNCTITGTANADVLVGTSGPDVICAGAGNDTIRALGGDDIVLGGRGDDRIYGGDGDDKLAGGSGADEIHGGNGDDLISGGGGDDTLLGGPGSNDTTLEPVRDEPAWSVRIAPDYRSLPDGTKVKYTYDLPSGNCINYWQSWEDTVGDGTDHYHNVFSTVHANPWESCAWEKSYGDWTVQVTTPAGEQKAGRLHVSTGSPNVVVHYAETVCDFPAALGCTGGSDRSPAEHGSPPMPAVRIGPFNNAPASPDLNCSDGIVLPVGKPLDPSKSKICDIIGNPRPDLRFVNLPPGVTASRWPTQSDNAIVLQGTVTAPWRGNIAVYASLPSGWHEDDGPSVEFK